MLPPGISVFYIGFLLYVILCLTLLVCIYSLTLYSVYSSLKINFDSFPSSISSNVPPSESPFPVLSKLGH